MFCTVLTWVQSRAKKYLNAPRLQLTGRMRETKWRDAPCRCWKIQDIHKSFGEREVLKGVGLTVEKGSVVAILGPSGSGKTTLLRCINFLEKADSGSLAL